MASEIRVNKIENRSGLGTVTFADTGVDLAGIVTATTFSGSGASLTNLPAANVTGTLPAISGANLTNLPAANLTGSLPAISGANLTGIAATDNVRTGILDVAGISTFRNTVNIGAAVTISESGIEASGIGITCASINESQIGGRRNIIINGAMQVAQRGTSSTSEGFVVDRMKTLFNGTDEAPTTSQESISSGDTGPYELGFTKYLRITNGNQTGGAGAADYILFRQALEAQNIANSGWRSQSATSFLTLSFWVKSSVAQTFYANIQSIDGTQRNFPFSFALSAATWTKVIKTIPGNTSPTVDIDNDNGAGLYIDIWPFAGTNYTSSGVTLESWATFSNSARFADNTTTWWTTNDATFDVTGMQLEVGSQATAFEHRSFGEELQLCKRYFNMYSRTHADSGDEAILANGFWWSSSRFMAPLRFDVPMRTNSWSLYKVVGSNYFRIYNNGGGSHGVADFGLNGQAHVSSAHLNIDSGVSSSGAAGVFFTLDTAARIGFDAEL